MLIDDQRNVSMYKDDSYNYNAPQIDRRFASLGGDRGDADADATNKIVKAYDKRLFDYLVKMHQSLRSDVIDVDQLANTVDALEHLKKEQDQDYYSALLYPETSKGAKIPSTMPVPSSSFQMHQSTFITTNAAGHASLVFNPFFMDTTGNSSTIFVNNSSTLTGNASNNNYNAISLGQTIPAVYNEYRVVSASVVVKYVGRLDIVQGVIGGAIMFDNNVGATTIGSLNGNLAKYGDFNLAMDAYYTQENLALNGLRCLYFPLDPTFEQYYPMNTAKTGFGINVYIYGGVPSSASYKVDIYVNYECLAEASFLHYIPVSCSPSGEDRQVAVQNVQKRPITDENEFRGKPKNSFWAQVKNSFGKYLPGVAQLAGLIIPQAKGLGLAVGAMNLLNNK